MTKKLKPNFQELAEFIASDYTLDIIQDIVYPTEIHLHKPKMAWFAAALESRYDEWIQGPKEIVEELEMPKDVD